jgi:hypothetical protein
LSALKRGDYKSAREYLLNALRERAELGVQVDIAYSLEGIAALNLAEGNPRKAVRLLALAEELRIAVGAPRERAEESQNKELLRSIRQEVQPGDFVSEWVAGKSMPVSEAIAYALV